MSKLAIVKKIGVKIPQPMPADVTHLVAYFGAPGFTPAYDQPARVAVPIGDLPRVSKDGTDYFVFDPASVSASFPATDGEVAFAFTLADNNDNEEGDFSPLVSIPLDREPPPTLEAPVLLD